MADRSVVALPVIPDETFELQPPNTKDLLFGSGPRLARDAMLPMLAFYAGWRLYGLVIGILASAAISIVALWSEKRQGRRGHLARITFGIVLFQGAVGLITGSEKLYLAQPVLVNALYGFAFLGSVVIRRPLTAVFAEEMYAFPDEVRKSETYLDAFTRISLVWGVYLVGRSVLRLATLSGSSVEAFIVVNFITGVPVTAFLLSWSVWYGVRFFRRSEEWGDAIRVLDEMATTAKVSTP
ncbi:MAG: VC0807 family protein [Acidimicrobiales bacterium]